MTSSSLLPALVVCSSLVPGLVIFLLPGERVAARTTLNIAGAVAKLVLLGLVFAGYAEGREYESRLAFLPGLDLVLRVDPVALLFVGLSAVLWLITTVYAIGYLEHAPHRSRFFGFFSLAVTATMGIALAGNLLTFFLAYEALTLVTYPLIVHRGTEEALRAGRAYLAYTLGGGAILLVGVVWLHVLAGPVEFGAGGTLPAGLVESAGGELVAIFALLVAGLGVKAALVPLHGWLPQAMVAPAPVSALLHAVAVVKAGAYGILRVVYDLFGIARAEALGVLEPLAIAAAVTIVYGSLRALFQTDLKRRLAYSTVSQLSYIALGVGIFGPLATTGALVHLVHQGLMKVTLFFCAGNMAETLGIHRIDEMRGVGQRMPLTMGAFTIAALGMIGVPPVAGFISKWYLGLGGLADGDGWVVGVLLLSGFLNAAYFLPPVANAWFAPPSERWRPEDRPRRLESRATLLLPAMTTAALSIAAGLLAGFDLSPLGLARDVVETEYGR